MTRLTRLETKLKLKELEEIIKETDKKISDCASTNHAKQKFTEHLYCTKCLEIVHLGYQKIKKLFNE